MKVTDFKDEAALDLLAEIIEPASVIFSDDKVKAVLKEAQDKGGSRAKAVAEILKLHKKEIIEIMAALDGVPVKDFHCNILTLPKKLLEILNDEELMDFFASQAEELTLSASSGLHTENTEEAGK